GVRSQRTDIHRGSTWTVQLLEGHEQRIKDMTRFPQDAFLDLLNWLKGHTNLDDSNLVSAEEKLFMFLYIVAHGTKFRVIAELFQHSMDTVHKVFYEILDGLLHLHKEIVKPPPDKMPDAIERDDKLWPWFADCSR
ncbi:hypothetical protein V8E54_009217, partial [Elaphomyces granulatus]